MISFRSGGTYLYFDVPEGEYRNLLAQPPGTYFNNAIRDNYISRHIGGENEFLSIIDPSQLESSQVFEENPELEIGAEWILNAAEEGTPQEIIDSVANNMGISDLKLQQLLNRARR